MLQQTNFSGWDYETHPHAADVGKRCAFALKILRALPKRFDRYGLSTLPGHKYIFKGMAPIGLEYLVGNYRGSDYPHLLKYEVQVGGDKRVGAPSKYVKKRMREMETQLQLAIEKFEYFRQMPAAVANPGAVLAKFVTIVSHFLTMFLTIHPYANGNGHMGRLLVWILLGRQNYWPVNWPLDERPNYSQALSMYRDGKTAPLVTFLLKCILG